ncbi:hypothetical protein F4802DRAFT_381419 [Xylaria palmicola]|nr:hypothetical protein F4802DRAFT_381419 [Xylaria palmicola]
MSTTSYSSSGSRPTSRQYDTGFPASFTSCTTSMRHPDAVVDPDFAISAEHIDPAKTLHRSRKSLLRKHRRTISHGKINEGSFGQIYADSAASGAHGVTGTAGSKLPDAFVGVSQQSSAAHAETPSHATASTNILGLSPGFQYADDGEHDDEEQRKANIFRKLMNKS